MPDKVDSSGNGHFLHLQTCSPSNHGIKHLGYLLFWSVPVSPVAYEHLKTFGFTGEYAPNHALEKTVRIILPDGEIGPEDLAAMPDGTVYTTDPSRMLAQIDGEGRVLRTLQDPNGTLGITTGGKVVGDQFYVMTLDSGGFVRMPVADMPPLR